MNTAVGKLNANASDLPSSQNLESLRAAAAHNDPAAIDATARKFESLFAQQLMKSMRDASGSDAMFPGDSKTYRDLYDREVANKLSQGRGLGMQAMIRKSLGAPASTTATTPASSTAKSTTTALTHPNNAAMPLSQYTRTMMPPRHVASPPVSSTTTAPTTSTPTVLPTMTVTANASPKPAVAPVARSVTSAIASYRAPASSAATQTSTVQGSGRNSPVTTSTNAPTSAVSSHGAPNRSLSPEDFIAQVWPHAQRAAAALGVSPQTLVAQAALESGWGKHVSGDNNLFGIKAGSSWTGATKTLSTTEVSNGQAHRESASFRSYASVGDSFDDYVKLLKNSPRYAAALGAGYDTHRFAGALQKAGYATDPNYAAKVESIARGPMIAQVLQKTTNGPLLASR